MLRFIVRRTLGFIPVLLGVVCFTFVLARSLKGGPFDFAGDKSLPESVVANLEAKYHLDWPMWKQFVSYMIGDELYILRTKNEVDGENVYVSEGMAVINGQVFEMDGKTICRDGEALVYGGYALFDLDTEACGGSSKGVLRGDLGPSFRYRGQTVNDIIGTTFPLSAQLGIMALMLGGLIGLPAGIIAAIKQNSWADYSASFVAILGLSIPSVVIAPLLIWLFAVNLGWFPAAGWGAKPPYLENMFSAGFDWVNYFKFAVLPVIALGTGVSAIIARLTRASLLQVIREDYIRTARSKGLKERLVIWRHALRNSMIPVVTVIGPIFAGLVTGTLIIEQFFGLNGMGKHFIQSITNRDYPVLIGATLVFTLILVVANLLVDLSYAWLDPRIRLE